VTFTVAGSFGGKSASVGSGDEGADFGGAASLTSRSDGIAWGEGATDAGVSAGEGEGVSVAVGLGEGEGVSVAVGLGEGEGVSVAVGLGEGEGVSFTVGLGEGVAASDGGAELLDVSVLSAAGTEADFWGEVLASGVAAAINSLFTDS
jgi:hypothetical protein